MKIGRNPRDFDKTMSVKFGARIYKDDAATTFDAVPETSDTIKKDALPAFVAAVATPAAVAVPDGAASELTALALATCVLLFSVLF